MANKSVTTTHPEYDSLRDQWMRCRDCSEGSDTVKSRKTKYLPSLDSHKKEGGNDKYANYLMRALFYNATGRTIQGLSGSIFQKAPAVTLFSKDTEEDIKDITLTGEPLEMFAFNATKEFLITGRYGILVDMSSEESTMSRPYWVGYRAENIINWRYERMGGKTVLILLVLREFVDKPEEGDDCFCVDQIEQYRVLKLVGGVYTQQVYRETGENKMGLGRKEFVPGPVIIPQRRGKALDFIPFSLPWSVNQPPLINLVDVNLAHYRANADLKHGLHFTALPTPWVSGQSGDTSKPLSIGSGTAWALEAGGKAGMLEFTGQGLGAIREDLLDMQKLMATLGARILEDAPKYAETATAVSMRHAGDYSTLRALAQVVEQQLAFALKTHCWWMEDYKSITDVPCDIQLNKLFFDRSMSADELRALLLALQGGAISYKTFYGRLAETGWSREAISAEAELLEIESQKPGIGQPLAKPNPKTGLPSEKVE